MELSDIVGLIGFIGVCFAAASMGSIFRPGKWYEQLSKPSWRPPNWLFAPVWTTLYLAMAASGWLVWRMTGFTGAGGPLAVFFIQLVLNTAWTPIFFGLRRVGLAFVEIIALWLAIVATIILFRSVNELAAWLLVPYLAWVSFAAALNYSIWRLNRKPGHAS
jgi:translocator protein